MHSKNPARRFLGRDRGLPAVHPGSPQVMKLHLLAAAALAASALPVWAFDTTLVTPAANSCADAAIAQSHAALTTGRLHDAIGVCNEALNGRLTDADRVITLSNRGVLLAAFNQPEAALADLNAALERAPQTDSIRLNRGAALLRAARYDEARADFDHIIANRGTLTATAYFNRGITNEKAGNAVAAYRDYQEAV